MESQNSMDFFEERRRLITSLKRTVPSSYEVEDRQKCIYMYYKFDEGPVLYSLFAFNVGTARKTCPQKVLEMRRDEYPLGMGCVELDSRIYFIGGQCKIGNKIFASKKVYILDLGNHDDLGKKESLLVEGPKMNSGKSNPTLVVAHGKIYVVTTPLDYDPNVGTLGPLSNYHPDYWTEISDPRWERHMLEVFDPNANKWDVLHSPDSRVAYFYTPIEYAGHAVVHDKIIFHGICDLIHTFDMNTHQWELLYHRVTVDRPVENYDDALVRVFLNDTGLMGRGVIVNDTLYAFSPRKLMAYHISNNNEDTSFPFGSISGLPLPLSTKYDSTGGSYALEASLIPLGGEKFCLVTCGGKHDEYDVRARKIEKLARKMEDLARKIVEDSDALTISDIEEDCNCASEGEPKEVYFQRGKRDVHFTIFRVIKAKCRCQKIYWSADVLDSYIIEEIDANLGTFFFCFALEGRIEGCWNDKPKRRCTSVSSFGAAGKE